MTYQYPSNVTTFAGYGVWANSVTEGYFGLGILLMIFFVSFISLIMLRGIEPKRAFAGGSFFTMVLAIVFRVMNILSDTFMFACIILCAVSLFWIIFTD